MDRIVARRNAFESRLGDLAWQTRRAATQHQGALTVGRRIQRGAVRAAGMRVVAEYVEVKVGTLAGAELFDPFDPARAVSNSLAALEVMRKGIGGSDPISTMTLTKRRKAFERTFEDLERAARMYAAAQEFFTVENFRKLLDWANNHGATKIRYESDHKGVVRPETGEAGIQLAPVADLDDGVLELIREYRRAD
jgi:hypothetical protein